MRKILKPIIYSFLIVIVSALFLRALMNTASATVTQAYDIVVDVGENNFSRDKYAQTFTASSTAFGGFALYSEGGGSSATNTVYICEGAWPASSDYVSSFSCGNGAELVYTETLAGTVSGNWTEYIFDHNITLDAGEAYYFSFSSLYVRIDQFASQYSGGAMRGFNNDNTNYYSANGSDFRFKTFYNLYTGDEYADDFQDVEVVEYNEALEYDYQYASFSEITYCAGTTTPSEGFECVVPFRFNSYAVGSEMYIFLSSASGTVSGDALASTTIVANSIDQGYITVPDTSESFEGQEVRYCAFLHDPLLENDDVLFCNWKIGWLGADDMEYLFMRAKLHRYDITEACADMDDTASTTFRYGIECGFRKVLYWAMTPQYETQLEFLNATEKVKGQFPMSVYYQVRDNLYRLPGEWRASTTTTTIPLVWHDGTMSGVTLLSSTTISSALGDNWTTINDIFSYVIYFYTLMVLIGEIMILGRNP